jgi:hypothetical protein
VDRGQDDAVAGVVEHGQAPAQVPADVAERVVAHDGEVPQRVRALRLEGCDLLPQSVHVLGQRVDPLTAGACRRTTEGERGERAGDGSEDDGDHIEHGATLSPLRAVFGDWSRPVGHGRR